MASAFSKFLFGKPTNRSEFAFVVVRLVVAAFWINSDMPRWVALASGTPQANGFVRNLFGAGAAVPLTYLFTLFETLGAIALILGLLTRIVSVWALVEFAITGSTGVMIGNPGLAKDFALFAGALGLLLNGCFLLSIDALLAKSRR